jgi:glycine cleavage system aminomethyltransferase T
MRSFWREVSRVVPAGLGAARDTLRSRPPCACNGNDIDDTTTVLEADLVVDVGWKKEEVHRSRRPEAPEGGRRVTQDRRLRDSRSRHCPHGYDVYCDGRKPVVVTSGTQTPFLKKEHRMAYVRNNRTAGRDRVRSRRPRLAAFVRRSYRFRSINVRPPRRKSAPSTESADRASANTRMYPADFNFFFFIFLYTKDHEWVKLSGGDARVASRTTRRNS